MTYSYFRCRRCGDVLKIKAHEDYTLDEHLKQKHPLLWKKLHDAENEFSVELKRLERRFEAKYLGFWFKLVDKKQGRQR